jgi:hypothetical protein
MLEALSTVPVDQLQTIAQAAEIGVRSLGATGLDGVAAAYTTPSGGGCEDTVVIYERNVAGELIDVEVYCV